MGVEEQSVVEAVVRRNKEVSTWMQYIYKYNGEGYIVEVPITDNNKHLVDGEEITLSMSILLKDK